MNELKQYLRGRFFAATFKTATQAARHGAFKLLGYSDTDIWVLDLKINEVRRFKIYNLIDIRCGSWEFKTKEAA